MDREWAKLEVISEHWEQSRSYWTEILSVIVDLLQCILWFQNSTSSTKIPWGDGLSTISRKCPSLPSYRSVSCILPGLSYIPFRNTFRESESRWWPGNTTHFLPYSKRV